MDTMISVHDIHPRERDHLIGTTAYFGEEMVEGVIVKFAGNDTTIARFPDGVMRPSFSRNDKVFLQETP